MKAQSPANAQTPKTRIYCLWSIAKEHIIYKPRIIAVEPPFPSVTDPQIGCLEGTPWRSGVTITVRENKPYLQAARLCCIIKALEVKSGSQR